MYIETKHIHRYQTNAEFEEVYRGSGYTEPWVGYVDETSGTSYNKKPGEYTITFYDGNDIPYPNNQQAWEQVIAGGPTQVVRLDTPEQLLTYVPEASSPNNQYTAYFGSVSASTEEIFEFRNDWYYYDSSSESANTGYVYQYGTPGQTPFNDIHASVWSGGHHDYINCGNEVVEYFRQSKNIDIIYYPYQDV